MIKQLKVKLVKLVKMEKAGRLSKPASAAEAAASEAKAGNGAKAGKDAKAGQRAGKALPKHLQLNTEFLNNRLTYLYHWTSGSVDIFRRI